MFRYCDYYWRFYIWHTDILTCWHYDLDSLSNKVWKNIYPPCLTKIPCHDICGFGGVMCTHISNMALDGGTWLASRPVFFVPRNEPRYLVDKWLLRPTAALDIVVLQMFNQKGRSKMSARLFDLTYTFKNNTRKCNKQQTFLNQTINSMEHSHPRQIKSQLPDQ
jgi:hypothetical protein